MLSGKGVAPKVEFFLKLFRFVCVDKSELRYSFMAYPGCKFLVDSSSSLKGWKSRFFFLGSSTIYMGVPSTWGRPYPMSFSLEMSSFEKRGAEILMSLEHVSTARLINEQTLSLGGVCQYPYPIVDISLGYFL